MLLPMLLLTISAFGQGDDGNATGSGTCTGKIFDHTSFNRFFSPSSEAYVQVRMALLLLLRRLRLRLLLRLRLRLRLLLRLRLRLLLLLGVLRLLLELTIKAYVQCTRNAKANFNWSLPQVFISMMFLQRALLRLTSLLRSGRRCRRRTTAARRRRSGGTSAARSSRGPRRRRLLGGGTSCLGSDDAS
jgi:hypothetical protein